MVALRNNGAVASCCILSLTLAEVRALFSASTAA
jgi:hypothetical protein